MGWSLEMDGMQHIYSREFARFLNVDTSHQFTRSLLEIFRVLKADREPFLQESRLFFSH